MAVDFVCPEKDFPFCYRLESCNTLSAAYSVGYPRFVEPITLVGESVIQFRLNPIDPVELVIQASPVLLDRLYNLPDRSDFQDLDIFLITLASAAQADRLDYFLNAVVSLVGQDIPIATKLTPFAVVWDEHVMDRIHTDIVRDAANDLLLTTSRCALGLIHHVITSNQAQPDNAKYHAGLVSLCKYEMSLLQQKRRLGTRTIPLQGKMEARLVTPKTKRQKHPKVDLFAPTLVT